MLFFAMSSSSFTGTMQRLGGSGSGRRRGGFRALF